VKIVAIEFILEAVEAMIAATRAEMTRPRIPCG
jgi:hypothetical protein